MVGRKLLSDQNIGLDVQIPVDSESRATNNISNTQTEVLGGVCGLSTHTAGLYGAGAGLVVVGVGVAGGACLSSGAELQGLTTGVLGEIGVVGSTWGNNNYSMTCDRLCDEGHIRAAGCDQI